MGSASHSTLVTLCILCLLMARSGTSLSFVILFSKVTTAHSDGRGPVGQVIPGLVRKRLAAGLGVGLDGRIILTLHQ